ncbi:MAG: hypothetical protein IJW81_06265 [Clostridia bacterium]|nr:hypothetical protein [Clostridia bacterium]
MNFTELKKQISAISANFGKKMNKNVGTQRTKPDIHMGFQQLVENCFGNFPPPKLTKYGYPKPLENFCGKRDTGCGKVGKRAKKKNRPFPARKIPQESTENPQLESVENHRISQPRLISLVISLIVASRIGSDDSSVSTALMLE